MFQLFWKRLEKTSIFSNTYSHENAWWYCMCRTRAISNI